MRHCAQVLLIAVVLAVCAIPSTAQTVISTNNIIINFSSLGLTPSVVRRVAIQGLNSVGLPNGIFVNEPQYQSIASNQAQFTNGYCIFSNQITGVAYRLTISGYSDTVTNFLIPAVNPSLDANGNAIVSKYIGQYGPGMQFFYTAGSTNGAGTPVSSGQGIFFVTNNGVVGVNSYVTPSNTVTISSLAGSNPSTNIVAISVTGTGTNTVSIPIGSFGSAGTNFNISTKYYDLALSSIHAGFFANTTFLDEYWNNLNNWSNVNQVVSNNFEYSSPTILNPAGANYPISFNTNNGSFRAVGTVNLVTPETNSPFAMVGFDSLAPGSLPLGSAQSSYDVGIVGGSGFGLWYGTNSTAGTGYYSTSLATVPAGLYAWDVSVDPAYISWVYQFPGHTNEYRYQMPRNTFPSIGNFQIWNGDIRSIAGNGFGPMILRQATPTVPDPAIDKVNDYVIWTQDGYGQKIRVTIPAQYDSVTNVANLIVFCHGCCGPTENFPYDGQSIGTNGYPERPYFQTLLNANYIIASSADDGQSWGNPASVKDVQNLINWVRSRYAVKNIFLMGASMGGLTALNYIASQQVQVSGYVSLYGAANLGYMVTNGYSAMILSAYGTTNLTALQPSDPVNNSNSQVKLASVAMRFYTSPSDGSVSQSQNANQMTNLMTGLVPECSEYIASGGHADPSHYNAADTLAFLARCLTYAPNYSYPDASLIPATSSASTGNFQPPSVNLTNWSTVSTGSVVYPSQLGNLAYSNNITSNNIAGTIAPSQIYGGTFLFNNALTNRSAVTVADTSSTGSANFNSRALYDNQAYNSENWNSRLLYSIVGPNNNPTLDWQNLDLYGIWTMTNAIGNFYGSFSGNGVNLTNLNTGQLTDWSSKSNAIVTASVAASGNVYSNSPATFTAPISATNNANQFTGTFTGNGGALTNYTTLTTQSATNLTVTFSGNLQKFVITNSPSFYLYFAGGFGDASIVFTKTNNLYGSLFSNPSVTWLQGSNTIVTNTGILSITSYGTNYIRAALVQP